jgi:molecular chaperone GrpE
LWSKLNMSVQTDPSNEHPGHDIDNASAETRLDADSPADAPAGDPIDIEAALAEQQSRADENWDKYTRAVAELDNVRKRAGREVEKAHKFALERFSGELLAVKDSLELGLAAGEVADVESLKAGSEATLKLLGSVFEQFGVTEVDPEGEPFNPELHEAVAMQPSADLEPGSVLSVFQKGYTLNGRLLRPARVVVATDPPGVSKE